MAAALKEVTPNFIGTASVQIPAIFDQPGALFVLLPTGIKFPPIEKEWEKHPHTFAEATTHKGNIGAVAGNGHIGLDEDDPQAFEGIELPTTTTWETRPGRLGMRFTCKDRTPELLAKYGKKPNLSQLKLFKDGKPVGEVKLERTYQVIPPSWKTLEDGQRAEYKLLQDVPPVEISLEWLLSELRRVGITFSSKLDQNDKKPEGITKTTKQVKIEPDEDRTRRYALAVLQNETNILASTPNGDRNNQLNKSAFNLGQFVGAGVLSRDKVVAALVLAAHDAKIPDDEMKKTIDSGLSAGEREPREIPSKETEPQGPTVLDAFVTILENEAQAEKHSKFDKWEWRSWKWLIKKVVEKGTLDRNGEERAHKFLKKFKDVLLDYGIDYDDLYPLNRTKSNKEEFSDEIKAKALDVLKNGDPVQYIADSCGKIVLGAEKAFKKLTCCISVQNINQSSGLHPKLNGDSSGGKTFTVYTFAHHMPREAVVKGSMSAKAGFYHNDGARVLRILDDYQAGNEDLDTVIKQTSSEFHAEYTHRTVANHEAKTLMISSEQTWAITSVDSSQEIQVLNRQLPVNVDDSLTLTVEVNNLTVKRYCDGEIQYPVNEQVLVARCIIQTLRDEGYIDVRIPFGDRIEWLDTSNRRNPSIFMDLVVAYTGMFRHQRTKDSEGYYLATEEDFKAARILFTDKDGEELVKRLTQRERETIEFMLSRPEGITQDDLSEHLGISRQRAGQILYGQKYTGGLMQKVQLKEDKISEMVRISEDKSRTLYRTIYSLKNYDHFAGFDAVVRLKPASEEGGKSRNDGASIDASMGTNSGKDGASIESKKEKEKDKEKRENRTLSSVEGSSSHENEEDTCDTCIKPMDGDDDTCVNPCDTCVMPKDSGDDTCAVSGVPFCAICGADLRGCGTVTKNGKFYCALPGCGYPARVSVPV